MPDDITHWFWASLSCLHLNDNVASLRIAWCKLYKQSSPFIASYASPSSAGYSPSLDIFAVQTRAERDPAALRTPSKLLFAAESDALTAHIASSYCIYRSTNTAGISASNANRIANVHKAGFFTTDTWECPMKFAEAIQLCEVRMDTGIMFDINLATSWLTGFVLSCQCGFPANTVFVASFIYWSKKSKCHLL